MASPNVITQLTTTFGGSRLASVSDDDVFDDLSPSYAYPLQFQFHPAQLQPQLHVAPALPQLHQPLALGQAPMVFQQHPHPQYHRAPVANSFTTAAAPQFAAAVPGLYSIVDSWDSWLNMAAYTNTSRLYDPMEQWKTVHTQTLPARNGPRPKKNSAGNQQISGEKKVEEVDLSSLTPKDALLKAKIRLANLGDWKAYTKNNAWTPEIILGKPFSIPVNIKFLQLLPDAKYVVGLGFVLREDTPGLMCFSDQTLQWNSLEGAVHHTPRRSSSPDRAKVEMMLLDCLPDNILQLAGGKVFSGSELMECPKEFTQLTVVHQSNKTNEIVLRPYYKYSPCLYLSLVAEEQDNAILFTRKVMIHDIKMIPVEHIFNLMLKLPASAIPGS